MNLHPQLIIDASYFAAAFLFIYGLKRMSSPVTARSGIVVAGVGMLVATLASFLYVFGVNDAARPHLTTNVCARGRRARARHRLGLVEGKRVAMTAMPQMVALYNGMGGGAAAAIAAVELLRTNAVHTLVPLVVTVIGALIGAISLSGSLIAWAKLDGKINKHLAHERPAGPERHGVPRDARQSASTSCSSRTATRIRAWSRAFFVGALIFGVLMTMPIGGADMPVVISLYNAFTGLAVGFEGYVLQNPALMIAGMVVGSAGTLLTLLMAKAMNRSVAQRHLQQLRRRPATSSRARSRAARSPPRRAMPR